MDVLQPGASLLEVRRPRGMDGRLSDNRRIHSTKTLMDTQKEVRVFIEVEESQVTAIARLHALNKLGADFNPTRSKMLQRHQLAQAAKHGLEVRCKEGFQWGLFCLSSYYFLNVSD